MRFSSLPFLFGFLPITLAIYFAVPLRWRNLALLLTSLVFYGWGEPIYISIMVLSILIDYTHGLLVEKYRSNDKKARRFVIQSVIFNLLLLVSALIVFTDWFTGYTGYSLDLVVPILCSVTLVCNFIFAFLHSRFTANALVYLLMNIGVGLLPYILLFFRIDRGRIDGHSIPWVNCLIISVVTFLGLVIFKGRDLRSEIAKRLHL